MTREKIYVDNAGFVCGIGSSSYAAHFAGDSHTAVYTLHQTTAAGFLTGVTGLTNRSTQHI